MYNTYISTYIALQVCQVNRCISLQKTVQSLLIMLGEYIYLILGEFPHICIICVVYACTSIHISAALTLRRITVRVDNKWMQDME